ncbi:MAG: N-acetyltransferase [Candidatus Sericytochromatia bacterium]|nr:N-acetyltransferase [Candidatus Sericytochromatia bacterium]
MIIRPATHADLPAINAIYNHYVLTSTCTYQEEPETQGEREAWFATHGERHPVTVAEHDGVVIGWGSLSPFRSRGGYRFSVENSVYVEQGRHGQGIGKALMIDLIARATALGYRSIVAGVSADQTASISLHERLGFTRVALFQEVGYKFATWLDVAFLQLMLPPGGLDTAGQSGNT